MGWRRISIPGLVGHTWRGLTLALAMGWIGGVAAQPQPGYVVPLGLNPGQAVEVTVYGAGQGAAPALWTSFPATVELVKPGEQEGKDTGHATYRVTAPAELKPQIGALRVYNASGVSANVRAMLIDDLPTVLETGDNHSPATAMEVPFPSAIEGAADAEALDFFKFNAKAGQRVSVEVFARRVGTPLDPVVRLLDLNGRELAYSDDEGGLGPDCRFAYQIPADGVYTLELRDIRYSGGGNFRYRLRVGNFPLITTPYPLAGRLGASARLDWLGPRVDGAIPLEIPVAAAPTQPLAVALPGGHGSAIAHLAASGRVESVEFEPNDTAEQALPLAAPCGLSGRFAAPRDRDWFQFEAKAGQRFFFVGQARSLGSPTDLVLKMHNAEGGVVAEADDAGTEEGVLDFTAPADGVYRLLVEDLHQRGGPEFGYRISVEPYRPGFSLSLPALASTAPQGGVLAIDVQAARRDYAGPIALELRPAIEGLTYIQNTIPEGANQATLLAALPASLAAGALHSCRVVGKATINDAPYEAQASTLAALRASLEAWPYPPADLDGELAIGVGPVFPEFFKLTVEPGVVAFPQLVGATTFKVKAERMHGFDEQITLAVEGLPAEVTAEVKPLEKNVGEVELKLSGPATAAEGEHRFRIVGRGNFRAQPKEFALEVPLRVVKPLAVSVEMAGPLPQGAAQKLKAKLTRYGQESPEVVISLRGLPAGVTAPAEMKIAAGQNEAEFELKAAADAAIGRSEGLSAMAATKLAGRELSVASAAAALEVVAPAPPAPAAEEKK